MKNQFFIILIVIIWGATAGSMAQGLIGFANNSTVPVIDGRTGEPAARDSGITVGLYVSANLSAPCGPYSANCSDYILIATAPIVNLGVFNNGGLAARVDSVPVGLPVAVVVKGWTGGYSSFEHAIASGDTQVGLGMSEPFGPMYPTLGGPPAPNLVIQGGFTGFCVGPFFCIPEPATWMLLVLGGLAGLFLLR